MREFCLSLASILLMLGPPLWAHAEQDMPAREVVDPRDSICPMIESAAKANGLPVDFFTRVIWRESHFRPDVVGPVTRSGRRAQGIAQFMPATAVERGLAEPFDPMQALPKSGEFLAELREQFGNLGLAAAAYNAGPHRLREFIAGSRDLPLETRNYVLAVTGRAVEDWVNGAQQSGEATDELLGKPVGASCRDLMAFLRQPPTSSGLFQKRKVPSWCRHLYHPNVNICGSIHQQAPVIKVAGFSKSRIRARPVAARSTPTKN